MNESPPVAAGPQRLTPWLGVIGTLLLATLVAAGFVQVRQHALLNATLQYQDDYLVLSLYQLETEYLRLHERLQRAADGHAGTGEAVQLRYDIFVSRIGLLEGDRAQRLLAGTPTADEVLRALNAFTRHADLYLGPEAKPAAAGQLSMQAAQALLGELDGLGEPVHRLMLEASHQVARQVTERQSQVRQHNLVGIGLTLFLSCMVLVFALFALRQVRALNERHRRMERLADELRTARREADAASAAKSEFLADMSHELRTPLHGLMGMLELLRDPARNPQSGAWLATADDSAHHLLHLLDDLLDLSKLEAGTLALSPAPVSLVALVHEARTLMLPAAQAKGLELITEIDPALPPRVTLDGTRVRQVLFNLLANAVKYSERGAVVLRCALDAGGDGTAERRIEFAVADTGIGMDAQTVAGLFRRHSRADDPRARRQAGAGLGLAISRNLAALMDGEIAVHSTPGAGSVFVFRCPLVAAPVDASATGAGEASAAAGIAAPPAVPARPLDVLVVDDHPVNRLVLGALLERLGHTARHASDGAQALEMARQTCFDVVLMDVHMPVMDGVTATAALRTLPAANGRAPVIALTADVFSDTRTRCLRAGAVEVLNKPTSMGVLAAALARHTSAPVPAALALSAAADSVAPSGRLIDSRAVADVADLMGRSQMPVLYAGFFDQASDAAHRMREAMRQADTEALGRAAHAVKGAALNLGLTAVADAAARLSREAGTLAAAPLALAVQHFEELVDATRRLCADEGLVGRT